MIPESWKGGFEYDVLFRAENDAVFILCMLWLFILIITYYIKKAL